MENILIEKMRNDLANQLQENWFAHKEEIMAIGDKPIPEDIAFQCWVFKTLAEIMINQKLGI